LFWRSLGSGDISTIRNASVPMTRAPRCAAGELCASRIGASIRALPDLGIVSGLAARGAGAVIGDLWLSVSTHAFGENSLDSVAHLRFGKKPANPNDLLKTLSFADFEDDLLSVTEFSGCWGGRRISVFSRSASRSPTKLSSLRQLLAPSGR